MPTVKHVRIFPSGKCDGRFAAARARNRQRTSNGYSGQCREGEPTPCGVGSGSPHRDRAAHCVVLVARCFLCSALVQMFEPKTRAESLSDGSGIWLRLGVHSSARWSAHITGRRI